MRRLCATVLVMEAIVIALAIPVAVAVVHADGRRAGIAGGLLAVLALVLAGAVGRPRLQWPQVAGSVLQLLVIAAGFVVPVMFFLGAIFAGLWATAIWLGRRTEGATSR